MARTDKKDFRLWKRGSVYYYRLKGEKGWKSTGQTSENRAANHANEEFRKRETARLEAEEKRKHPERYVSAKTFGEYAALFFDWDRCPHCLRVRGSGGQIGPTHAKQQRSVLKRFVLGDKRNKPDPITALPLGSIRKGDVIDFRARMIGRLGVNVDDKTDRKGKRTLNSIMTVLSTVFSEAVEREDIPYNPAARLSIKYEHEERGIFLQGEMRALFPPRLEELGPWDSFQAKTVFLLAGTCGLRRNEIRALRRCNVDLSSNQIRVHEAFKGESVRGLPKWDKKRETRIPNITARHLAHWLAISAKRADDDPVFYNDEGEPIGGQWWEGAWNRAMKKAGIDHKARGLVPHSLRHTVATELSAAGLSDALIQAGLGWTNPATQKRYTHLKPEHMENQARIIDGIWGEQKAGGKA